MKFQKKIIMVYTIFSVIIIGILGSVFYFLSIRQYKEKEYSNIKMVSGVKLQQMEDMLANMDSVIKYFLSDVEILNSLKNFEKLEKGSYEKLYFNSDVSTIRTKISTYYLIDEFYRMIVFNKKGNVICNTNYTNMFPDPKASYATYPWTEKVSNQKGADVVIGLHRDDWGNTLKPQVISLVKEIQGMDMGYVEVQQEKAALDKIIANENSNITYLFTTRKGELLYAGDETTDAGYYLELMKNDGSLIREIKTAEGEKALCVMQESAFQNVILLTIVKTDIKRRAMLEALPISLYLLAGTLLLSVVFIYLTSRQLTRPIRQLQNFMETTHLDNLEAELPEKISNDEIETLYHAYRDVLERLKDSILKKRRMSLLQLQAQFDLLQAQINPHFIYNVLNVISNRGMISNDEVICDICGELAGMLRYATNTKDKFATVKDEMAYLERYLRLLKYRYDYKLSYRIDVDEKIYNKVLPKIVLQQIAENSVVHGYEKSADTIEIVMTGYKDEEGWYLKVHDEGSGIPGERLEEMEKSLDTIRNKLTKDRENVELSIGGMGLINTYARLYLLYNEKLIFKIISENERGTDIIIGVKEK